jgi:hypothetical protein
MTEILEVALSNDEIEDFARLTEAALASLKAPLPA